MGDWGRQAGSRWWLRSLPCQSRGFEKTLSRFAKSCKFLKKFAKALGPLGGGINAALKNIEAVKVGGSPHLAHAKHAQRVALAYKPLYALGPRVADEEDGVL
jgi:hypothetical protein